MNVNINKILQNSYQLKTTYILYKITLKSKPAYLYMKYQQYYFSLSTTNKASRTPQPLLSYYDLNALYTSS